jgi:hypothetical protein
MMNRWAFNESLGRNRLDALRDAPPFEEIARSIISGMRAECSHVDRCDDANGFKRLIACIVF